MGASDSKLVFKKGIFRLSEERAIPADDTYWTSFWELPETAEDVFSLFSPADVRRTRDNALENLETLILALTSRLFVLRHHPSFPDAEFAPELHALNCIRVLTRVLPFLYEKESLQEWEERFFWGHRRKRTRTAAIASEVLFDEGREVQPRTGDEFEDAKPLAEELIDTLTDLLFFSDLTVPRQPHGKPKVSYAIWQSGVGCNASIPTTKEHESNRSDILRLLLTLASQSMYMSSSVLPQKGNRTLTYLCTCPDKQVVLSVLCSLLNTTLKYNPASWRVPYNALVFKDPKLVLVTYTLQFLVATVLYPIPEQQGTTTPKNFYRHFLGRLHRPQDFQFIVDGMTRILNQPLQANSYIPGAQSSVRFAPEIIMLFWEITQCNKRFRSFMIDTDRAHDFVILILFYAMEYKGDASKNGVVRMCAFLLQTLSVEKNFGVNLNKTFESQETLPPVLRIVGFRGSYADFLIQSIYNLITKSQGKLSAIYPALLAVINNISPSLKGLSSATCSRIIQLFNSMSSPSFLMANETNHDLLRSLLESMNSIIEHQYSSNAEFVYAVVKNKKRFEALRSFTLESGQEEIERRNRRRKEAGGSQDPLESHSTRTSVESLRSPTTPLSRSSTFGEGAEEQHDMFAVGNDDDDDSDDEERPTPAASSPSENPSRSSSATGEDDVPRQLRGMSEKARGKMPAGTGRFSRQNSTTSLGGNLVSGGQQSQSPGGGYFEPSAHWIESWLPELPLHTILTVIQQLAPVMPRQAIGSDRPMSPGTLQRIREVPLAGVDPSPVKIQSFEWSQLAMGWYESLLWSFIFTSELQVAKGAVGIWNSTAIKLFRVQETAAQGPSLTSPRGAVDAVGSNIVSRIGAMNLRGGTTPTGSAAGGTNLSGPAGPTGGGPGAAGGGGQQPTSHRTG
ncbi:high-temperature-induced dauer-formation protein-domain-containing protein [Rhypophila decipiens]|uniref:High-temperature-induced dauer-formation protein-domain-containing protein n=1 Tax=Rhypophila decipiens TaxID=261697 RepID=A0AAN7BDH4_9PEZI|nr:high-temperature-induced dauer-formation protein-domain-containing protein [Rhypophila decipiens]